MLQFFQRRGHGVVVIPSRSVRFSSVFRGNAGTKRDWTIRVPEVSRFFGIVVAMYFAEHGPPHFHVAHNGQHATVEINSGLVHGTLAPRSRSMVLEWLGLHRRELMENWQRARRRERVLPIPPLE
jgi:hypothetical protein